MPGITGREMKAVAFVKCATGSWSVAASVTKGARFVSDGGMKPNPMFIEDRSFGETFLGPAEAGDFAPQDVTFSGQARYEDYNYILEALAMGSPAAVAISASAAGQTTSWIHVTDMAPTIEGLCATFAVDRKLFVDEIPSAKVYGFGETYGDGGVIVQSFRTLGNRLNHASSTNINSTVHGASYPALNGRIVSSARTARSVSTRRPAAASPRAMRFRSRDWNSRSSARWTECTRRARPTSSIRRRWSSRRCRSA
jgi:hypothetical protein